MKKAKLSVVKTKNIYSDEDELITTALRCLESRLKYMVDKPLNSSSNARAYLQLHLASEQSEVFSVLFMDNSHRLIAFEKMFYGTINEAVVYPRRIVQKALEYNAARLIVSHNHPSGVLQASAADIKVTNDLSSVLKILDIKLLDHIIVTTQGTYSFAEDGLL